MNDGDLVNGSHSILIMFDGSWWSDAGLWVYMCCHLMNGIIDILSIDEVPRNGRYTYTHIHIHAMREKSRFEHTLTLHCTSPASYYCLLMFLWW